MTSLLSAKKRAEEFATAIDGGADESMLHPELAELVGVVGTLQREALAGTHVAPRPEFSAQLRERLMTEAATALTKDNILALPVRTKSKRDRRIALVASSLVLVGGSAGMAAAAQNALPGEALYPIKRGLEKVQTELATSRADQGKDLLDQADNRLVEVRGLFENDADLSQVPVTIDTFTSQSLEASDVLIKEFETSRQPEPIEELRTFAADNLEELQELAKTAEPEHQDALAVAAQALTEIDERAQAACPTCAAQLSALKMPALFLAANDARDAMRAMGGAAVDNTHPNLTGEVAEEKPRNDKSPAPEGKGDQDGTGGGDAPEGEEMDAGDTGGTQDTDGTEDYPGLPDGEMGTNAPDGEDPGILGDILEGDKGDDTEGDKTGDGSKTSSKSGTEVPVMPKVIEDVADSILQ